eukprot:9018820-Karenia_brevis.AAC.1
MKDVYAALQGESVTHKTTLEANIVGQPPSSQKCKDKPEDEFQQVPGVHHAKHAEHLVRHSTYRRAGARGISMALRN